jgi:pSer/pThr/pTyr-binding forkhead associated (FHA) protein
MAAAPILLGFFVSFDGNDLGRFWPLHQGQLLVGRALAADNLDIAIEHNTTSARHAQLVALARPSRLTVQDIGSTNGTFVNDQRILPGQTAIAAHGDRIRFGGYTVNVVLIA